jgi:hypothetical protein
MFHVNQVRWFVTEGNSMDREAQIHSLRSPFVKIAIHPDKKFVFFSSCSGNGLKNGGDIKKTPNFVRPTQEISKIHLTTIDPDNNSLAIHAVFCQNLP